MPEAQENGDAAPSGNVTTGSAQLFDDLPPGQHVDVPDFFRGGPQVGDPGLVLAAKVIREALQPRQIARAHVARSLDLDRPYLPFTLEWSAFGPCPGESVDPREVIIE